tara:strand:- start:56 stop:538 length:483 start_codon:yes stop_codon:yes gene_type:complete
MRDFVAVLVVFFLIAFALSMATSLQRYKRGHSRLRRAISDSGRSVVAEIPGDRGIQFFTEDARAFHWSDQMIPKNDIRAARVLISGAPISVCVSRRFPKPAPQPSNIVQSDLIERERWDVAIDLEDTTILVECGAIRERVSQELARQVFAAVKADIELRH